MCGCTCRVLVADARNRPGKGVHICEVYGADTGSHLRWVLRTWKVTDVKVGNLNGVCICGRGLEGRCSITNVMVFSVDTRQLADFIILRVSSIFPYFGI